MFLVSALMLSLSNLVYAACGKVTIADMNWASAELMAEVDKIILEKGYGCEVELIWIIINKINHNINSMKNGTSTIIFFKLIKI